MYKKRLLRDIIVDNSIYEGEKCMYFVVINWSMSVYKAKFGKLLKLELNNRGTVKGCKNVC